MLKRKGYETLCRWKTQSGHKALCMIGARQTGKTTLIRYFGKKCYDQFVEINFLEDKLAVKIFDENYDADTLISNLTAYIRKPLIPGKTLIFFDEIQEYPDVRTAIKFLVEDGRFDYIESGSLLGVRHKEVRSYPVGFETIVNFYPMDFEEFLWANGVQQNTIDLVYNHFEFGEPMPEAIHETLLRLFYAYIVVGGMPEVVQDYVDTHDIGRVIEKQKDILALYRMDIAKYAEDGDKIKIRAIFDSIPAQLDDKNRRFYVNSLAKTARLNRYESSFRWLSEAGVASPCYNVTFPQPPLNLNEKHNLFKLYMSDTGLLCAACMDNIQFALLNGDMSINMGSILENVMAQQLKASGFDLYYYDAPKHGEIDFVLKKGTGILLVEIKSGSDYHKHKALDHIRRVDEWKFDQSMVFCRGNLEVSDNVHYYPWYMILCLKSNPVIGNLIYEVDLTALKCNE